VHTATSSPLVRGRVWSGLTALAVAAAWGWLGYGLHFSTASQQEWDDLDAGGRFTANFEVYFPYYGLTLAVTGVVILALLPLLTWISPRMATTVLSPVRATIVVIALAAMVVVVALFARWVPTRDYLLPAMPELSTYARQCLIIDACAVAPLIGAVVRLVRAWILLGTRASSNDDQR
jgi:hypothetical protein